MAPSDVRLHYWLHDPIAHSGERLILRVGRSIAEKAFSLRMSHSAKVILSSVYLRGLLLSRKPNVAKKAHVVPFGYIKNLVTIFPSAISEIDFIFFGRIEKYKGLQVLVAALRNWNGRPIKVLICGTGPEDLKLDGMPECVSVIRMAEFVSAEKLRELIAKSRVAIFPYLDATGTQALQTAGANGCLIVATDVGSFPEILAEVQGDYAWMVAPKDIRALSTAMHTALNSLAAREEVAQAFRKAFDPRLAAHMLLDALTSY
jgi:glycosyltransferase involved in cell wall biosynthesis